MSRSLIFLVFLAGCASGGAWSANWTEAEREAVTSTANPGWLVLVARDVETGEPIPDADFHAVRFAFEERLVTLHPSMMIDGPGRPESTDGRYRWELAAGWHQLRIDADGYRNLWTPVFRIEERRETEFVVELCRANRLRVTVLDERGRPVEDGGVHLTGDGYRAGMHIADGVGERLVPVDVVTVTVGDVFMEDYAFQKVTIPLEPGIWNEVTIRLRR